MSIDEEDTAADVFGPIHGETMPTGPWWTVYAEEIPGIWTPPVDWREVAVDEQ